MRPADGLSSLDGRFLPIACGRQVLTALPLFALLNPSDCHLMTAVSIGWTLH